MYTTRLYIVVSNGVVVGVYESLVAAEAMCKDVDGNKRPYNIYEIDGATKHK